MWLRNKARVLINNGANVHVVSRAYGSALYAAASDGHDSIVQLLIDSGARWRFRLCLNG
jgi:ankyrin repeat protein